MLLLVEVERSNVFATFTIRHEEDDLTPKSPGPRHCLVENRRPIRGADEHDVPSRSLQSRNAKWNPCAVEADHPRSEDTVEGEVYESAQLAEHEARIVDAVHQDDQHVQAELTAAHHAAEAADHAASHAPAPLRQGIDLIDEDDAATPDLGALACGPDHQIDAQGIDAEEHACERAAVGDVNRHVH